MLQDLVVMFSHIVLHVWHSPVRQLQGVSVAYFIQPVVLWETILHTLQKHFANVGLHIERKGRIEPGYISLSLSF